MKNLIAFSAALLLAGAAQAATKTYQFTATISSITKTPLYATSPTILESATVAGHGIALGATVSGIYTFDTDASPFLHVESASGSLASYQGSTLSAHFSGNGLSLGGSPVGFTTISDNPANRNSHDSLTTFGVSYDYSGVPTQRSLILEFEDADGSLLDSAAFPDAKLGQFASKVFALEDLRFVNDQFSTLRIAGNLTSLNAVSPVPEPSMALCLLAGVGLVAWRRKRGA